MNEESKNGLDDLFRKKLEDPVDEAGYREDDWANLENMLDRHKKRKGIIYWLPVISSAAALLLLFLGWWYFKPQVIQHNSQNKLQATNKQQAIHTGKNGGSKRQLPGQKQTQSNVPDYAVKKQTQSGAANYALNTTVSKGSSTGKTLTSLSAAGSRRDTTGYLQSNLPDRQPMETFASAGYSQVASPALPGAQPVGAVNLSKPVASPSAIKNDQNKTRLQAAYRPQFAMTVLAAPDLNGVGSFGQGKVGSNFGLLFSAGVFKKLTLSTGVLYSVKPYAEGGENYPGHVLPATPINIIADCRMLDIPINVGYQLYNKHQNKISVGTGLSSYIMLHESYTFNYSGYSSNYTVPNSSGYFFGVLNLNATYEHQINSKVGISLQPYYKLPLTNLGYSQVRLQSTGVAVGLNWNLNR